MICESWPLTHGCSCADISLYCLRFYSPIVSIAGEGRSPWRRWHRIVLLSRHHSCLNEGYHWRACWTLAQAQSSWGQAKTWQVLTCVCVFFPFYVRFTSCLWTFLIWQKSCLLNLLEFVLNCAIGVLIGLFEVSLCANPPTPCTMPCPGNWRIGLVDSTLVLGPEVSWSIPSLDRC